MDLPEVHDYADRCFRSCDGDDELLSSKNNTLELPRPIARLHFPRAHSAPLWRCGAMLSDQQKVRNIREYVLGQRRLEAAGKRLPTHRHWEWLQCVGCKIWNDQKLDCLEPPLCCHCCKLYRNVDSVRPAGKAARLARKRLAEKFRRRGVDGNGKRAAPARGAHIVAKVHQRLTPPSTVRIVQYQLQLSFHT